ncbi:hypothetical protein [Actinacidiphila glaucinigra]
MAFLDLASAKNIGNFAAQGTDLGFPAEIITVSNKLWAMFEPLLTLNA